jgi:ADP-ribose pyrophosphatase
MKRVIIERSQRVFDDFFKIDEAHVRHDKFDGELSEPRRFLSFERGDGVAAILMNTETERVILINQFRYPTYAHSGGWIIEAIAGMLGPTEEPEVAIRREILEETGYQVETLTHIATFYVSPGGSSERIILYYAEADNNHKIAGGGGLVDEHEDIQILEYTLPELWAALDAGQIFDAKTLIGLMWLRNKVID